MVGRNTVPMAMTVRIVPMMRRDVVSVPMAMAVRVMAAMLKQIMQIVRRQTVIVLVCAPVWQGFPEPSGYFVQIVGA